MGLILELVALPPEDRNKDPHAAGLEATGHETKVSPFQEKKNSSRDRPMDKPTDHPPSGPKLRDQPTYHPFSDAKLRDQLKFHSKV